LVVAIRFGRSSKEPWNDSRKVKEMSALKQRTKLANLYHYQMEELKDGTCLCEGQTSALLKKKQEESSGTVKAIQGTSQ
jgi:hypothetical protein